MKTMCKREYNSVDLSLSVYFQIVVILYLTAAVANAEYTRISSEACKCSTWHSLTI